MTSAVTVFAVAVLLNIDYMMETRFTGSIA